MVGPWRSTGSADRVERREKGGHVTWQVLDYKTGKVEGKDLVLGEDWSERLRDGDHGKALQLLLYAAMLRAHHPEADGIRSTIRAGRKGSRDKDSLLTLRWEGSATLTEEHDLRLQGWLREVIPCSFPRPTTGESATTKTAATVRIVWCWSRFPTWRRG